VFANATFGGACPERSRRDGDGKRVKSVINGTETTYFVGGYYEVVAGETGTQVNKYYYAGTQRIAMRTNDTLIYLVGDHLGSTSLTTDAAGNVVSETRYKAWGEVRFASGISLTDYTYTGQYSYASDFGLMFYNARWYDPYLNHFTQPDSIVPDPYNSQAWDRYAYALNNPVRYTDPSGHIATVCSTGDACGGQYKHGPGGLDDNQKLLNKTMAEYESRQC
jgi:RHS repeat-associated protein